MVNKILLAAFALVFSLAFRPAAGAEEPVLLKTCRTELHTASDPEDRVPTRLTFYRRGAELRAAYEQDFDEGETKRGEDESTLSEFTVRAGLSPAMPVESLNVAEQLILAAIAYGRIEGADHLNVDLTRVASVKIYTLGRDTGLLSLSVIEAKDATGAELGTFFGGSVATNCR